MFSWVRKLCSAEVPVDYGCVSVTQHEITYRTSYAETVISTSELAQVTIRTTNEGPCIEDVYFVLQGSSITLSFPQQASGTAEFLKRLSALPGFDNEKFSAAMSSTNNDEFLCWERSQL